MVQDRIRHLSHTWSSWRLAILRHSFTPGLCLPFKFTFKFCSKACVKSPAWSKILHVGFPKQPEKASSARRRGKCKPHFTSVVSLRVPSPSDVLLGQRSTLQKTRDEFRFWISIRAAWITSAVSLARKPHWLMESRDGGRKGSSSKQWLFEN